MADELKDKVLSVSDQIIGWRRKFHRHPELGLECHKTAEVACEHLLKLGINVKTGIAQTGVLGTLTGDNPGPVVALRVDMDALPLAEQTGLPFASEIEGVMHACGHDGHTAMGMGVATVLSKLKHKLNGTVKFIFQPGEESPGGAKQMVKEGVLENPRVNALFGCHIFPSIPTGNIGIRYGAMTAGNDEFTISLHGVGGHAAYPFKCSDSVAAAGHLITAVQTIVSRNNDSVHPLVISITEINGGSGYNIIPETVTLRGTIRSISDHSRQIALKRLEQIIEGIKSGFGIDCSLQIVTKDFPLICNEKLTKFVEKSLVNWLDQGRVQIINNPSMGAEDLAYFSAAVPTTYLRIGSYDEKNNYIHNLHTPYFNFDEKILIDGTYILSGIILDYLNAPV